MSLKFRGSQNLRLRLVCATLSGRSIRIGGIRERDQNPGLRDYEACLLRLLEKVTDGCTVEINETGTALMLLHSPERPVFPAPINSQPGRKRLLQCHARLVPESCNQRWPSLPMWIRQPGIDLQAFEQGLDVQGRACAMCRGSSRVVQACGMTAAGAAQWATSWNRWSASHSLARRWGPPDSHAWREGAACADCTRRLHASSQKAAS